MCEDSVGPDAAVTESTMDVAECEDMAQTTFCGDLVQPAEHGRHSFTLGLGPL